MKLPSLACCLTLMVGIPLSSSTAIAQVTPDSSLNTQVESQGNIFNITGGTTAGSNLFHSFSEFSIPQGSEAFFNNSPGLNNIISRVTGGNVSDIQGSIQSPSSANFFLINPAGIVFSESASLNIGGSFVATTANSVVFDDGFVLQATDAAPSPLLTVSIPVGLQFGSASSAIQIQGSSLTLPRQQTFGLLGNDVNVTNANITSEQGRIELGGVSTGTVSLVPGSDGVSFGYEGVTSFSEVTLNQNTIVDVSGEGAGNVTLQGSTINIIDNSLVIANTVGSQDGGSIILRGSESVEFSNPNELAPEDSPFDGINAEVAAEATGRGANLIIETPLLSLSNEVDLLLNTFGSGDTGDITITTEQLLLNEGSGIFVFIEPDATGNGGKISLTVDQLELRGASQIGSGIFGAGRGSDITVIANSIQGSGETPDGAETALITSVVIPGASGDAGNLSITTERLELRDGGQVFSGTFGEGNAGNVDIQATSIELIGTSVINGFRSSISATANQATPDVTLNAGLGDVAGNSGDINIQADRILVRDGAAISSSNSGPGSAASITIQAQQLELIGADTRLSSTTSAEMDGGEGGNITLQVDRLSILNGANISSQTSNGGGNAGNIDIQADNVNIDGFGVDEEEILFSNINGSSSSTGNAGFVRILTNTLDVSNQGVITVSGTGTGNAGSLNVTAENLVLDSMGQLQAAVNGGDQGNINLNVSDLLVLRNGSSISADATGASTGGNVNIDARFVGGVAEENSDISANAESSFGGRIRLTSNGVFGLDSRSQLTSLSDITASSALGAEFSGTVDIVTLEITPNEDFVELPSGLQDSSDQVVAGCGTSAENSFIATGRGGLPHLPGNELINPTWSDMRDLSALAEGGTVAVSPEAATARSTVTGSSAIAEINGWRMNAQGKVELMAVTPGHGETVSYATCAVSSSS